MAILGIDEVGRGPWAGPLVVGAVILPPQDFFTSQNSTTDNHSWLDSLTDSKQLTTKKRESLNSLIHQYASATALGWVSNTEIDELGLSAALKLATHRAVTAIQATRTTFSEIIIDGTVNFLANTRLEKHVTVLKKADSLIKEVSAASIIAKVARDHYMVELAKKYPGYGFEKHVGYGTAKHRAALTSLGPCPAHRLSFKPVSTISHQQSAHQNSDTTPVKTTSRPNSTTIGQRAETVVANHLIAQGHTILARNYKTRVYEIDLISSKNQHLYFTEVKYRRSTTHGAPLEFITKDKQNRMQFAATAFLKTHPKLKDFIPHLAVAAVSGSEFHLDNWFTI